MPRLVQLAVTACVALGLAAGVAKADTWKMEGVKQVALHTTDGKTIPIGTITFTPQQGDQTSFKIDLDPKPVHGLLPVDAQLPVHRRQGRRVHRALPL